VEKIELDNCMELDGDMFLFKIRKNDKVVNEDFPINLKCFTKSNYKSEFLNSVVLDINAYKIGW